MQLPEIGLRDTGFATLPTRGVGGAGAGFGQLYRELQTEVHRFIEQGSPAGSGLSPEGMASRLQGAMSVEAAPGESQQAWLAQITPLAEEAGEALGVAPEVVAAHAALESGWGQKPIRRADGGDSHNLFALKASGGWRGERTEVQTTEYEQGQAQSRRESFRSYEDAGSAFRDFTRLLQTNPRYQAALGSGSDALAYGQALQRGGYATDPAYADKLARVAAQIRGAR